MIAVGRVNEAVSSKAVGRMPDVHRTVVAAHRLAAAVGIPAAASRPAVGRQAVGR